MPGINEKLDVWLELIIKDIGSKNGIKEQPWDENNPEYMFESEALIKLADGKIPLSTLSRNLKPNGTMRYMRKGRRCKVHIGDFCQFIKNKYPQLRIDSKQIDELIDDHIAGIEARKAEERQKSQTAI